MKKVLILSLALLFCLALFTTPEVEANNLERYYGFDINSGGTGIGLMAGAKNWLTDWNNIPVGVGAEGEFISYNNPNNITHNTLGLLAKANFELTDIIEEGLNYPKVISEYNMAIKAYSGVGIYFVNRGDEFTMEPGLKSGTSISFPLSEAIDFRTGLGLRTLSDFGGLFINFSLLQKF